MFTNGNAPSPGIRLRPCDRSEIPLFANRSLEIKARIEAFLEAGTDCAEVEHPGYGVNSTAANFRSVLKRLPELPVEVIQRQNRIFLVRKEESEDAAD